MSESTSITAEIRENNISAKILRKSGEIPAIVYGQENDPKLVKILEKDLVKILENPSIFSQVIETINVPLKFINEEVCIGVKQQGGMISHLKNEIELTCNAQNLPEFIEIDMKDLEIGSNVMQSQIILPEGVSLSTNILNNQDQPVASVNVTRAALDIDDEPSEGEQDESEESTDEASETKEAADESSSEEESKD